MSVSKQRGDWYSYFFESSPAINLVIDSEGRIVDINRSFTETFGYVRSEIIGTKALDMIRDIHHDMAASILVHLFDGDDYGEVVMDIRAKDGTYKTIYFPETSTKIVIDSDGAPLLPLSSIDITSLMATQNALHVTNKRLTDIFAGAGEGIVYIDADGAISDANPALFTQTGVSRDYINGKNAHDLVRELLSSEDAAKVEAFLFGNDTNTISKPCIISYSGRNIELTPPFGRDESGGITLLVRDITEQRTLDSTVTLQRDLSVTLSEAGNLDDALIAILDKLLMLPDIDSGGIYILDLETDHLVLKKTKGLKSKFIEEVKEYGPETMQYSLMKSGMPLYLHYNDLKDVLDIKHDEGLKAIASIPIGHRGAPIAALNLASHTHDSLSDVSKGIIEAIAVQLGGAISRLRAEAMLVGSEEKFRKLFSNMVDAAAYFRIVYDDEGIPADMIMEDINRVYEGILGKSRDDIIGKRHTEVFSAPEDRWNNALDRIRRVDASGKGERYEFFSKRTNRWFAGTTISPKKGYIVNIIKDVTERKMTELRLRESEERFRRLAEASQEGIIILEGDIIIDCNEAYEHIFGYPRIEVIGKSTLNFTAPENRGAVRDAVVNNLENTYDGIGLRKDGSRIYTLVTGKRIPYMGKTVRIAAIRDVTSFKQAADRITASLEEKEVLLREIHHRVKNNLQVIISLLMLQADRIPDSLQRAMFSESVDRVRAMSIIHELLYNADDVARIGAHEYLHRICDSLASVYARHPSEITVSISVGDLSLGLDTAIPCGLIVNELVSNALKHGLLGRSKGLIEVAMNMNDGNIILRVSDNGAGLPADLDWHNAETLGLKIVRLLAERQLGGTMRLSPRKTGATFVITFPANGQEAR